VELLHHEVSVLPPFATLQTTIGNDRKRVGLSRSAEIGRLSQQGEGADARDLTGL
jgi:hypothetical protein